MILRHGVLLAVVLLWLPSPTLANDLFTPFLGTYVGTATVLAADGRIEEERDMEIIIEKGPRGSFVITWINVTLVDGRRDVPGVRRRVDEVMLEPSPETGIFNELARRTLFERRREVDVVAGDPLRWARIEGDRLGVYSMVILPDGSYVLQDYQRVLTEVGLDIEFRRVRDGEVIRRIVGSTVRVD